MSTRRTAERRGDAGVGRHDHDGDREFSCDVDSVQRAGAAEGDERESHADRSRGLIEINLTASDMLALATFRDGICGLVQAEF